MTVTESACVIDNKSAATELNYYYYRRKRSGHSVANSLYIKGVAAAHVVRLVREISFWEPSTHNTSEIKSFIRIRTRINRFHSQKRQNISKQLKVQSAHVVHRNY